MQNRQFWRVKRITLSEGQILAFLNYVCEIPIEDINKKRALINTFVHSVYLYDDHFTIIVNASKNPLSIDHIPPEEIHTSLENLPPKGQYSTIENVAPPWKDPTFVADKCGVFSTKSVLADGINLSAIDEIISWWNPTSLEERTDLISSAQQISYDRR